MTTLIEPEPPRNPRNSKQHLATVLNGYEEHWTNGVATVHYRMGTWVWFTPTGCGESDEYGPALLAVAPYLSEGAS